LRRAFVDTSFLASIVFDEPAAPALIKKLRGHDALFASDLMVTELLAVAVREKVPIAAVSATLRMFSIVIPDRSLEPEVREVLSHGYLRGADLWHVACALFLAGGDRSALSFLTRDASQSRIAKVVRLNDGNSR
jgi:predicted nucleic acid-binding protein